MPVPAHKLCPVYCGAYPGRGDEFVPAGGVEVALPEQQVHLGSVGGSGGGTDAQKAAVLLNAGAGIFVAEKGKITLDEGIKKAEEAIASGKAIKALDEFVRITNE